MADRTELIALAARAVSLRIEEAEITALRKRAGVASRCAAKRAKMQGLCRNAIRQRAVAAYYAVLNEKPR